MIKRVNIVEQVSKYINTCITNGTWKPGDKIDSENELTNKLQVSRPSIRYAIQQFIAIGVLESQQGKGTYVKSVPVEDILYKLNVMYEGTELRQLLEFRMAIEVEVCRLIAKNISDATLDRLEYCLNQMRNSNSRDESITYDMEFHTLLHRETKNRLIIQSMESIREETMKQLKMQILDEKTAIKYHTNIFNALKKHDEYEAAEAMREHIFTNIQRISQLNRKK